MNQTIKLNLIPNYNSLPQTVKLKQYDKTVSDVGKTLTFELYEADMPYEIPTDAVVTVRGTKSDKTGYEYECTFDGNQVYCNVEQQMTVFACKYDADLRITKDSNIIGTANFKIDVTESALADDTVISETELPLLEKAIEAETTVIAEVKKIQSESAQIETNKTNIASLTTQLGTDETQIATNKSDIATVKGGDLTITENTQFTVNGVSFKLTITEG